MAKTLRIHSLVPDVGRPPVAHLAAGDVHDAQLPEHHAVPQADEHLHPVLSHHVQLAPLDDVHLLTDIALPADVVPGGEDLQLQLEDEGLQKTRLAVLEIQRYSIVSLIVINLDGLKPSFVQDF